MERLGEFFWLLFGVALLHDSSGLFNHVSSDGSPGGSLFR
jgi:hypothetical protein